jgi:hypothetical protein
MATQISAQARAANIQIGDYVSKSGIYTNPGVVVEKKEDGTVVVDTSKETIDQYHRYANTTGLTPEEKDKFNAIMDEISKTDSSSERLAQIDSKVSELRQDPTANKQIMQALRNQQAKLIRKSGELPRMYSEQAAKVV